MLAAHSGIAPEWFGKPDTITRIEIDPRTGHRVNLAADVFMAELADRFAGEVVRDRNQFPQLQHFHERTVPPISWPDKTGSGPGERDHQS
jgi:hypothetical protein